MIPLIPALSGALVVAGLLLAVWALIPRPESVGRPSTSWREGRLGGWWQRTDPRMRWALGAALSMGVVIATVTGFVLAIVVLPLAVVGVPYLAASSPQARRIARLEGIAEWTRNLSGVLSVGVGLEQALIATLRSTPEAIRPEVGRLVARLHARWRTEPALRAFADDLDDATGDMVAGALILSSRRRGAGLAAVLTGLAETVAEDVTARRKVESDRAKPRQTARIVTGLRKVEDARERYHFEVATPQDAEVIVSALYLPTTSARRRAAAVEWLVDRTTKERPVRISLAMRRFVVLKQPVATRGPEL